jgi:hypothetical protein
MFFARTRDCLLQFDQFFPSTGEKFFLSSAGFFEPCERFSGACEILFRLGPHSRKALQFETCVGQPRLNALEFFG